MRTFLTTLGFSAFLALATLFAQPASAQIGFSIHIGAPPPPRAEVVVTAPFPGAIWVPGYYVVEFGHYRWIPGSWQRPPYEGARWFAPRYENGAFIAGRWDRDDQPHFERRDIDHRDFDRGRDHDRGDRDRGDRERAEHDRGR